MSSRFDEMRVFSGTGNIPLTHAICGRLGIKLGDATVTKFSNENIFVKLNESVREKDVFVVQSLASPLSDQIMELLILLDACKRASAGRVTAVLPPADEAAAAAVILELHRAGDLGEQRVVLAHAHVIAGADLGAALADEDLAGLDQGRILERLVAQRPVRQPGRHARAKPESGGDGGHGKPGGAGACTAM